MKYKIYCGFNIDMTDDVIDESMDAAQDHFMEKVNAAMDRAHFPGKVFVTSIIMADENGKLTELLEEKDNE